QGSPRVVRSVDDAQRLYLRERDRSEETGAIHQRRQEGFAALVVVVDQIRAGGRRQSSSGPCTAGMELVRPPGRKEPLAIIWSTMFHMRQRDPVPESRVRLVL